MNLTPLKHILFIENLTCVFKNFLFLKRTRVLAICWTCLEIVEILYHLIYHIQHEEPVQIKAHRIYFYSITTFSIYLMLTSLYYSKKFYKLLSNFDAFHIFYDDTVYSQITKKAQNKLTISVVLFCFFKIFVSTFVPLIFKGSSNMEMGLLQMSLSHYTISLSDFRYIFQYFVLHAILFVLSEQLKTITRYIGNNITATKKKHMSEDQEEDLHGITPVEQEERLKDIDKWMSAYNNINESSNLCNTIFSIQLTIMLLIVTSYYIILLYSIAIITVKGVQTPVSLCLNCYSMAVFLTALFVISRSGQNLQNSSLQLRQKLCELCVDSLNNEQYYKLTKDLLRCVRTRPVRIHMFGLHVNMSLLPSCVAFFTSYTVIALQINNVL